MSKYLYRGTKGLHMHQAKTTAFLVVGVVNMALARAPPKRLVGDLVN